MSNDSNGNVTDLNDCQGYPFNKYLLSSTISTIEPKCQFLKKLVINELTHLKFSYKYNKAWLVIINNKDDPSKFKKNKRLSSDGYRFSLKFRSKENLSDILSYECERRDPSQFLKVHIFQNFIDLVAKKREGERKNLISRIDTKENVYFKYSELEKALNEGEVIDNDCFDNQQPRSEFIFILFYFILFRLFYFNN